ncbi:MAG: tRNA 2-selenouridine(34) synthase MnmH [Desulfuromonadaceae bacterium]|nr:tRNA 2-selenouridine(34) synthase MnmH [Desulfuromonadaceae bacterium]MDD5105189.1 tRNA 2-selenouridine(34) synthase MnmH [Desulfuromonadaceae bacterium]
MPEKILFTPHLIDTYCLIDVRTPLEYEEDHIPGAYNVPLLNNEERVEVGTIYKQVGPTEARRRGLELTCSRFYGMVEQIISLSAGKPIVVYCWRGGLRSYSVAMLVETCGTEARQLSGGYKAFRAQVSDYFDRCDFPAPLIVMHGMTGTGKTTFINGLNSLQWATIDLEGIACHRGSAFGALGLEQNVSQKQFETLLWDAFRRLQPDRPIVLEGESQRIGRYSLPGSLYEKMAGSCKIWCHAAIETRIERLSAEYARLEYQPAMLEALDRIRKKLGGTRYTDLKNSIESWDVAEIARSLIVEYYDRMYYKQRSWRAELELELEDFTRAEAELERFWREYTHDAGGTDGSPAS